LFMFMSHVAHGTGRHQSYRATKTMTAETRPPSQLHDKHHKTIQLQENTVYHSGAQFAHSQACTFRYTYR
jgi:hypothetical protein